MNTAAMGTIKYPEEIDISGFVIEDDTPVDSLRSEKQMRLLTTPLFATSYVPPLRDGDTAERPWLACANVGLFVFPDEPPLVPDVMLSADVRLGTDYSKKENRTYFAWILGKVPDVVIEVVSNTEGDELGGKRRKYARMRIPHYVVWDPEKHLSEKTLQIFDLRGDLLVPSESTFFPEVGLGVKIWNGVFEKWDMEWLRWYTPDGALVPTGAEMAAKEKSLADAAVKRADAEAKRADVIELQLKLERERAERLAEKLRALGVNLD